jgi:hypothetical protein
LLDGTSWRLARPGAEVQASAIRYARVTSSDEMTPTGAAVASGVSCGSRRLSTRKLRKGFPSVDQVRGMLALRPGADEADLSASAPGAW